MAMLRAGGRSRGQGLAEFALVLPIFLTLLIGMVDVGRAVWANNSVANAAREAARLAAVHGGSCEDIGGGTVCSTTNYCPVGPAAGTTAVPAASTSCPYPSPSRQSIYNVATGYLVAGGTGVTVTACYATPDASCGGNADSSGASNLRGNKVTVVVSSQVPMILGAFLGVGSINVSATSTMLVNH
jgi:type II secretory pathway pseudopilin PulG